MHDLTGRVGFDKRLNEKKTRLRKTAGFGAILRVFAGQGEAARWRQIGCGQDFPSRLLWITCQSAGKQLLTQKPVRGYTATNKLSR